MKILENARAAARFTAILLGMVAWVSTAQAQSDLFRDGWTLDPESSSLSFQSIKKMTKAENSSFASLEGQIDEFGNASVVVFLESVDTKIDLRNVRMRFLFFETFQFPEARIAVQLDPASLADLRETRSKTMTLPFSLDLHGTTNSYEADVIVNLLDNNRVSVAAAEPISIPVSDYGLLDGLAKLEEAAGVQIVPSATVAFNFVFSRNGSSGVTQVAALAPAAGSRALESSGDFALEECRNRFETLSRSGGIYFGTGSARLDRASAPLLNSLAEIVNRCPGLIIEVGGHTDSEGSTVSNQRLSERRANSVRDYLINTGVDFSRIQSTGYGESRPIATNDTSQGRARNRRIEFSIVGG